MPWSDEERLDRVYRRAASIRLARRFRGLAVGAPLALVLVVAVAALAGTDDGGRPRRVVAADVPTTTVPLVETTLPTVVLPPTTETTVAVAPTTLPKPPPTTLPRPPDAENCGGYVPGDTARPRPPEGMRLTAEVSKAVVHRGEEVALTLRATWTGTEPFTHTRRETPDLVFVHMNGPIYYSSQGDGSAPKGTVGEETFQPSEEKTFTVRWKTSQSCGPSLALHDAWLKAGTYTVEGIWESSDSTWVAEPAQFQLVD